VLHLAASRGHIKVVAELLARHPSSLADEDWEGQTPLFCAASKGHQDVVDLFPLTTDQVFFFSYSLFLSYLLPFDKYSPFLLGASPRQQRQYFASFGGRCKALQAFFDSKSVGDEP